MFTLGKRNEEESVSNKGRYRLVNAVFSIKEREVEVCIVEDPDLMLVAEINSFLISKALRSIGTARTYGNIIVPWLNFLLGRNKTFTDATKKDVNVYLRTIGMGADLKEQVVSLNPQVDLPTLKTYITVLKELYKHMDGNIDENEPVSRKTREAKGYKRSKQSYVYGQIWEIETNQYLDNINLLGLPDPPKHKKLKHYSQDQVNGIMACFRTLRDRAIFALTLEGLRIDEVLSIEADGFDPYEAKVRPTRSKGKVTQSEIGWVHFSNPDTARILQDYINLERTPLEQRLGRLLVPFFVNLKRHQKHQGKAVSYSNFLTILKTAANLAGFDPQIIVTHAGRSTDTQNLVLHAMKHPEDGVNDRYIIDKRKWKSGSPLLNYLDPMNEETQKHVAGRIKKRKTEQTERQKKNERGDD